MNCKYIAIVILSLAFFSCKETEGTVWDVENGNYEVFIPLSKGLANSVDTITIESQTIPLLKNRSNNLVLSWNFEIKSTETPLFVRGLSFSLKGTENLKNFEAFSITFKGGDNQTVTLAENLNINADSLLTFSGKRELVKGTNRFELHCKIADNADIRNHLEVKPLEMLLSGKHYELNLPPLRRKLGIALLQHGQNGVDTYRIPGLVTTEKGTLIAVYDMRHNSSKDLQEDVDVGMSRSIDGGQTWEKSDIIIDMGEYGKKPEKLNGVGDPSILYDKANNTLWVAALWMHGLTEKDASWWGSKEGMSPRETGQLVLVKSTNDGKTWSEPYNITSQIKEREWQLLLQGPGRGIALGDSILIFPAQFKAKVEEKAIDGGEYTPFSTIIYSKNSGKTWEIGMGAKSNTTEAQVIALNDGSLMLNMRDDRNRKDKMNTNGRAIAVTNDLGATWTTHATSNSALVEPNCMASLIKEKFLIDGEKKSLVFFSNPNSKFERNLMSIKVSFDDAQTWEPQNTTLIDAGRGRGYSCMTKIDDEHLGILYEGSGADLVFQIFHINELVKK